jgi:hypothetical protein
MALQLDSAHSYGESESMNFALAQLLLTIGSFIEALICRDSDAGMESLQKEDEHPPSARATQKCIYLIIS